MSGHQGVGIIGAGLIGAKRAEAILRTGEGNLVAVSDVDDERREDLARKYGATPLRNSREMVLRKDIDAVIVAVPNALAAPLVLAALKAGKHVLCEKPLGINSKESLAIVRAARRSRRIVKVGFNHRFHAALLKAHEICEEGGIGRVLFIRARYGHGGRKGLEKEWRFDKKSAGGGELLDQGVHVIDLARWFAGDFDKVFGVTCTKFWKTDLEDNAFVLLLNRRVTVSFHVSTTNWKNIFSFEVFGDRGYLQVEGKGGSYGDEMLTYGRRNPEFGVPDIDSFTFSEGDKSWDREWHNFMQGLAGREEIEGTGMDGFQVNKIVEAVYRSSRLGRAVRVPYGLA
jgi:predicted dehydrogenase